VQTLRKHLEVIELTTNFSRSNLCNIHTLHHSLLLLTNIRSRVADYIIFLTTLYDIIFQWWSYTRNSDQTVFVEHEVVKKQLKLPPQIVMS
jgi:L-rhamnose mutarotase